MIMSSSLGRFVMTAGVLCFAFLSFPCASFSMGAFGRALGEDSVYHTSVASAGAQVLYTGGPGYCNDQPGEDGSVRPQRRGVREERLGARSRGKAGGLPCRPVVGVSVPYSAPREVAMYDSQDSSAVAEPGSFWKRATDIIVETLNGCAFRVALNAGASAPLGIPSGTSLVSYAPAFAPIFSVDYDIVLWEWFVMNFGLQFEYKGMTTQARVRNFYTEVAQDGAVARGHFTGFNQLKFLSAYVTLPLRVGFVLPKSGFSLRLGGYASYAFSRDFKGHVSDGYFWTAPPADEPDGESTKLIFSEPQYFNFGSELRHWDFGMDLMMRQHFSRHFFFDLGLSAGFRPIFKRNFTGISYKMYNMYVFLGVGYKFLS